MEKTIIIKGKSSEVDKIIRENSIREKRGLISIEAQTEKANVSPRKKGSVDKDSKEIDI